MESAIPLPAVADKKAGKPGASVGIFGKARDSVERVVSDDGNIGSDGKVLI